jgi:hypothetical protein
VPLVSFNLGVEIGQIAVVAIVLPLIWRLRQRPVFVTSLRAGLLDLNKYCRRLLLIARTLMNEYRRPSARIVSTSRRDLMASIYSTFWRD